MRGTRGGGTGSIGWACGARAGERIRPGPPWSCSRGRCSSRGRCPWRPGSGSPPSRLPRTRLSRGRWVRGGKGKGKGRGRGPGGRPSAQPLLTLVSPSAGHTSLRAQQTAPVQDLSPSPSRPTSSRGRGGDGERNMEPGPLAVALGRAVLTGGEARLALHSHHRPRSQSHQGHGPHCSCPLHCPVCVPSLQTFTIMQFAKIRKKYGKRKVTEPTTKQKERLVVPT